MGFGDFVFLVLDLGDYGWFCVIFGVSGFYSWWLIYFLVFPFLCGVGIIQFCG